MSKPGQSVLTSTDKSDTTPTDGTTEIAIHPAIGMAVVVVTGDGTRANGVIVDDFGDLAGTPVGIGTERVAQARRWAVDIDGGHIVFVDDDAIVDLV